MQGITPFINTFAGCDYHRVTLPLDQLGVDIHGFMNIKSEEQLHDIMSKTRVAFFNRTVKPGLSWLLEKKAKYGFKIVVDVDDYWHLYPSHHQYKDWKKNHQDIKIQAAMFEADAVFVTTDLLYREARKINKNVHVIPNALPFGIGQFNSFRHESDRFRVIYAGGSSHFWDIRELRHAFEKLNRDNLNAEYILAGHSGKEGGDWDKIERSFNLNEQLKGYTRRLALPLDQYMHHYNYADISLAPLISNYFNQYKSNLKVIEAGCKNIPIICSDSAPYNLEPKLDKILIAGNTKTWYESIKYFTKNPNAAIEKGLELGEYVRENYDLAKVNLLRKQIFENL